VRCYWERLGKQFEEQDENPMGIWGTQTLCHHFWPWLMAGAQTVGHSVIRFMVLFTLLDLEFGYNEDLNKSSQGAIWVQSLIAWTN
jgi:tryptophan-rich sensory protein